MERNLAWAANVTGDAANSQLFNEAAAQRREAMMALLWDGSCGEGQGGGGKEWEGRVTALTGGKGGGGREAEEQMEWCESRGQTGRGATRLTTAATESGLAAGGTGSNARV
jgi:hypothetical protein